jgi:hypothetical protein
MNALIFVMSAMSRYQIPGAVPQYADEQGRNRVDYGLPLEPSRLLTSNFIPWEGPSSTLKSGASSFGRPASGGYIAEIHSVTKK